MKQNKIKWIVTIVYIISMTTLISFAHSWHYISFNNSNHGPIADIVDLKDFKGYKIVHVLGEGCGCSEFVSEYLYRRGSSSFAEESVFFIGDEKSLKINLRVKGFHTNFFTPEEILKKEMKTEGVPYFQIYDNENKLLYSGGYDNKMITKHTHFRDIDILQNLKINITKKSLPIYGCATSKELQNILDPLNIKYY